MISRGFAIAAFAAAACAASSFAQVLQNVPRAAVGASSSKASGLNPATSVQQNRILWIRNDKTGQVIAPGTTSARARETDPVFIYNNFDNPAGVAGLNLNWNHQGAYTDPDFTAPPGDPLRFGYLNISSDPTDPDDYFQTINGEKLSLIFEPYRALNWPVADLNTRQPISEYTSVVASYSEQFEIRVCRIYFLSLTDVDQPFHELDNPYQVELQLSFAFVSFPFMGVESVFSFDLTGFEPPLEIKGDGLVLTHWMQLSEPPQCNGDLNGDGLVEDADFVLFLAQYNVLDCADETMPEFCSADFNFDGFVDDTDFLFFILGYNDLLCPAPYVIRKAFAPLAGGRFRWDTEFNLPENEPLSKAVPTPDGWPFPNALVTTPPLGTGPYLEPFNVGCAYFRCQPSFLMYFSTLTGFQTVAPLDMLADDLKLEYERFMNSIAGNEDALRPFAIYDVESFIEGGLANTDWVPSSTAKRFSIIPTPDPVR